MASPAFDRSLRPPQPCGPGSGQEATADPSPERVGGALKRRAKRRLRREPTRNRNIGRTAQPRICFRVASQVVKGILGIPALPSRPLYSCSLAVPGGSRPPLEAARDFLRSFSEKFSRARGPFSLTAASVPSKLPGDAGKWGLPPLPRERFDCGTLHGRDFSRGLRYFV